MNYFQVGKDAYLNYFDYKTEWRKRMSNDSVPYLCGGVFFALLVPVKYDGTVQQKVDGSYVGISDPEMMSELIYVVTGTRPDSKANGFSKDVSRYRTCQFNGGKNVPFNKADVISSFTFDIENEYDKTLNRMIDFTDKCILSEITGRMNWLIKVLLDLIERDTSIQETDMFYISTDRQPVTKEKIREMSSFELQPFLLGVLHYFISAKKTNKNGANTYNHLFSTRDNHIEGDFDDTYLPGVTRTIMVTSISKRTIAESVTDEDIPDIDFTNDSSDCNGRIINQYIQHPTIINQNAEKIYNIEHVDYLD